MLKRAESVKIINGESIHIYSLYDLCIKSQKLLSELNYFKPCYEKGIRLDASVLRTLNLLYNKWAVVDVKKSNIPVSQVTIELLPKIKKIRLYYKDNKKNIELGTYNVLASFIYIATTFASKYLEERGV